MGPAQNPLLYDKVCLDIPTTCRTLRPGMQLWFSPITEREGHSTQWHFLVCSRSPASSVLAVSEKLALGMASGTLIDRRVAYRRPPSAEGSTQASNKLLEIYRSSVHAPVTLARMPTLTLPCPLQYARIRQIYFSQLSARLTCQERGIHAKQHGTHTPRDCTCCSQPNASTSSRQVCYTPVSQSASLQASLTAHGGMHAHGEP